MKKVIKVISILIILLCINTNAEKITIQKRGSVGYLYGDNFQTSNLEYQIFSYENNILYLLDGSKNEIKEERELEENGYINDPGLIYILSNGYPTKSDKHFFTKYELNDSLKDIGYYITQIAIDMYSQYKNNNPSLKVFGSLLDIDNNVIGNFTGFDGTGQSRKIYDAAVELYRNAIQINDSNDYKAINFYLDGLDENGNIKLNFEYGKLISDVLKINTDAKMINLLNTKIKILNKDKQELEVQALNNNDEFRIAIDYNKDLFSEEKYYTLDDQLKFNLKGENTSVIKKYYINEDTSEYIFGKVENKPIEKNININLGYKYIDYPVIKIGNRDTETDELVGNSEISLYDSNDILVDHWTTDRNNDHEIILPFGDYYVVVDKQAPNYKEIFNYIEFSLKESGERFVRIDSERNEVILPDTGINSTKVNYLGIAAVILCMICFLFMGLKKEN